MDPRIFKFTDTEAPTMAGEPGRFVIMLKKILVDGYGSGDFFREPLDWEMVWDEETNLRAAFRSKNIESSGDWIYVDDTDDNFTHLRVTTEFLKRIKTDVTI